MEKMYRARRHLRRRSYLQMMHSFAWMVVCGLLLATFLGMQSQAQSLKRENDSLRQRLATLTLAAPIPASTCRISGDWKIGQANSRSVMIGTTLRSYLVHLPDNFNNGTYYPILMFYVGRGAHAATGEAAYGLDALPAIVVYPEPTMGDQDMTAWEGAPYSSGADDIALTTTIIDTLQAQLCTDRTRVYASGLSNGGGFASLLSCKLPDRFAAYAVLSGAMYAPEDDCTPPKPASLINVHGDADPTVPYFGSLARRLPAIEPWMAQRAADNGCAKPVTSYPTDMMTLTAWDNCKAGSKVENIRIEGGGHMWGLVPNESIWRFLMQFTL